VFLPGRKYVVLSFARSGNSPESMATFNLVKQVCPSARQVAITCNKNGKLALACKSDPRALYIELPEETNDQSLVMTSSYSTMAFTALALCFLDQPDDLTRMALQVGAAGNRIIKQYGDVLQKFAQKDFSRACFLGSNALYGTMQECHLKMQEMTEGRVAAMFNSFVGLRHGPQVFASHHCAVVAAVGTDPYVLPYELDMLREIKAKKQGVATLVICAKATPELRELCSDLVELFPTGDAVHDDFRVMTDVMVGQILGTFKSMHVGLKPDNPSVSGTINRVVQGVTIYPYPKGA
jgi:tagatose-6-phosphate ketose/aldose isomerase